MVVRRGDKQQKLQVEKLTEDFMEAVERYSQVQKIIASRRKANLLLISIDDDQAAGTGDSLEDSELRAKQLQEIQTENRELKYEQDTLLDREQRVKQIEDDVLDVNEIMRELASLVNQQGEAIGKQNHIFSSSDW